MYLQLVNTSTAHDGLPLQGNWYLFFSNKTNPLTNPRTTLLGFYLHYARCVKLNYFYRTAKLTN